MTEANIQKLTVNLPAQTVERLRRYRQATNGAFDNCAGRAINDGIDAVQLLHPTIREAMGEDEPHEMSAAARLMAKEAARLSDILLAIETMTATGEGLSPEEAIEIHILAAEGRADDPHAWRADPAVISRLRAALRAGTNEGG